MYYKWNWIVTYHPSALITEKEPKKNPADVIIEQAKARLLFYMKVKNKK